MSRALDLDEGASWRLNACFRQIFVKLSKLSSVNVKECDSAKQWQAVEWLPIKPTSWTGEIASSKELRALRRGTQLCNNVERQTRSCLCRQYADRLTRHGSTRVCAGKR